MPEWLQSILTSNWTWGILALVVGYLLALVGVPIYIVMERRGAGLIQRRPGPNRRGPYGLIQPIADAVKLAVKEDFVPEGAHRFLHALAPMIVMTVALTTFAVIPWSGDFVLFGETLRLQLADLNFGLIYILAIASLGVYGVTLAGWSSNNKYSLLGGLRAGAQMVSYEIAMSLAVVAMFLLYDSVKLDEMIVGQAGPVWKWGVFQAPLAFLIFLAASYAEANRVPFDLPEAESEIVAGYHLEYSSFRFGLFYMGEYAHMAITAVLTVVLFFGGWQLPWIRETASYGKVFPWLLVPAALLCLVLAWDTMRPKRRVATKGNALLALLLLGAAGACALIAGGLWFYGDVPAWAWSLCGVVTQVLVLMLKFVVVFWLFIWVRWTFPRMRYDQLMRLGWKILLPLGLINIGITAVLVLMGWQ